MEPIKLTLSQTADEALRRYLRSQVRALIEGLSELHTTKLPRWRKAYQATPAESVREFPFHNASNLVVPIIAIHSDTLLARVMAAVIKTQPIWVARLIGEQFSSQDTLGFKADDLREAVEMFLQYVGLEPGELDLYRVYHEFFGEAIRLGTSVVKSPQVKRFEDSIVAAGDSLENYEFERRTVYEGPRPEKIPFEDFLIAPYEKSLETANFKAHRVRLQKFDLEERAFRKIYDPARVQEILGSPDRTSPRSTQQQAEDDIGARTTPGYGFAEWDIYECHFRYRIPRGKYVRLIAWYHEKTNTLLRCYYHYYPDEIFVAARLFYRDDMFHGYGFCEMLEMPQEEVSKMHNERRDNQTIANTRVWRVDPDSTLHKGYRVFPGAMLPAGEKEIEPLAHGDPNTVANIEEERLALELAEKRSGVSPPMQGSGAGSMSKRGVYTAMGTLSILQEGNTRTDLNITDIRYAHTKLGRLLLKEYAEFGIGERGLMFGEMGRKIEAALRLVKEGRIALPVYASSASVNREVEKQNDLLLTNIMQRHHSMMAQMLAQINNPMIPEGVRKYLSEAADSASVLMKYVMRHFGYDEVDRLVPEPSKPTAGGVARAQLPGGQATSPPAGVQPGSPGGADVTSMMSAMGGAKPQ